MKRCAARPYEGSANYIFISYCHKDKKYVFPIIERLVKDGYRVWYDEGIDPGSEWPEIIASHLNNAAACIAFITDNALNSHNCRREINFALLKKKPFISVILEKVKLSLGMEMQLSATQSIFKYTLQSNYEFFQKLYEAKFLKESMGTPNPSIIVSKPQDYVDEDGLFSERDSDNSFSNNWFVEDHLDQEPAHKPEPHPVSQPKPDSAPVTEPKSTPNPEPEQKQKPVPQPAPLHDSDTDVLASSQQQNHFDAIESESPEDDEEKYVYEDASDQRVYKAWLVRVKTDEKINIERGRMVIGRSKSLCDYIIFGNETISRRHVFIQNDGHRCVLIDNNSTNFTFLNASKIDPNKEYQLSDGDSIRLSNEKFIFHEKFE